MRKKHSEMAILKHRLWGIFSRFIRLRDNNTCVSCGKKGKGMHAGHYIPRSVGGLTLYFDEQNVNCQCSGCNMFRSGNLSQYALFLETKYGAGILQKLEEKRKTIVQWTKEDYEEKITYYRLQLENLIRDVELKGEL